MMQRDNLLDSGETKMESLVDTTRIMQSVVTVACGLNQPNETLENTKCNPGKHEGTKPSD